MERVNHLQKEFILSDAINCSSQSNFTQIPNELLRNPKISAKAKIILCILLSNKNGWHSCNVTLLKMLKEGKDSLQSGLQELEKNNYLLRIRYRDKKTKMLKGSFWAYTDAPNDFKIKNHEYILAKKGLEIILSKKPQPAFPDLAFPDMANPQLIIYNNNNTNIKKERNRIPPSLKLVINYCQERNNLIDPNTFHDFYTSKNWFVGKNKMVDWQATIRTWERKDKQQDKKYTTSGSRRSSHSSSEFRRSDKTIKND